MTAGFVLVPPEMSLAPALWKILWEITLPASLAALIGNYLLYAIGYFGGKPLIERFSKLLGFEWDDIKKIKKKFGTKKRQGVSIFIMRTLPIMPLSLVSGAAGVFKIDWKRYGIFSFLGLLPRNFLLAFVGWKLSSAYMAIANHIDNLESLITYTILIGIVLIIVVHKIKLIQKIENMVTK
ncbi:VTT domain-containing protein [Candidatus Woesearchaeota archaeon]|nr:VTT domain-containing protein [Candidatus Woesearchaeota archaeon]